jgi:hypothetical protein
VPAVEDMSNRELKTTLIGPGYQLPVASGLELTGYRLHTITIDQ